MSISDRYEKNLIFLATFFLSLSTFVLEIVLARIFSVTVRYHFAFFIISLVMFGLAFGGSVLFVFEKFFFRHNSKKILAILSSLHVLSIIPVIYIVPRISFPLNFMLEMWPKVSILFIVCVMPFIFVGIILSCLFLNLSQKSGKLYFYDLTGAAAGAVTAVLALTFLGGINSLITGALIASVAFVIFCINLRNNKLISVAIVIALFITSFLFFNYKYEIIGIKTAKGMLLPATYVKWNAISMVDVIGDEYSNKPQRQGWGMSSTYKGAYPPYLGMRIDGDAYMPIVKYDGDNKKVEFLKYDITSFAYYLMPEPKTLVIGSGGGRDILTAFIFGSDDITGVEVNPIIATDVMRKRFKDYSGGIYAKENVNIVVNEARSFIRHSKEKYDLIQLSLVDTWAATNAGAYSLTEDYLYTVEAITQYLNHLSDNGILTISYWNSIISLRLSISYLLGAEKAGITNPQNNMAIVSNKEKNILNSILKKRPFTTEEIAFIKEKADILNYKILYLPTVNADKNSYQDAIRSKDPYEFARNYQTYNVKPTTDDCPYFTNVWKLKDIPKLLTGKIKNVALFALYSLLLIALLMVLVLVLIPVFIKRGDVFKTMRTKKVISILYFACLGIGFMLAEVSLLQKFILFLGHPVYSITVMVFSILVSGGIGSYFTDKLSEQKLETKLMIRLAVVGIVILLYNLFLTPLFELLLGTPLLARISVSILFLAILGFFIGMPFPLGMRITGRKYKELIPFCWAVNGSGSVIGSMTAIILSMNIGFINTLFIAAAFYFTAFFLVWLERTQ